VAAKLFCVCARVCVCTRVCVCVCVFCTAGRLLLDVLSPPFFSLPFQPSGHQGSHPGSGTNNAETFLPYTLFCDDTSEVSGNGDITCCELTSRETANFRVAKGFCKDFVEAAFRSFTDVEDGSWVFCGNVVPECFKDLPRFVATSVQKPDVSV
jgi:hypothetical protein